MNKNKYNLAVFIGRMQPLHNGHIRNIQKALDIADHVLVIAGSANQPRTPKNPFTVDERIKMIKDIFPTGRVRVKGVEDFYSDTLWLKNIQSVVHHHIISNGMVYGLDCEDDAVYCDAKIAILGHNKDHTSFYLRMFPTWDFIEIGHRVQDANDIIASTNIRDEYFTNGHEGINKNILPATVLEFLARFSTTENYTILKEETAYIKRYHKSWEVAPYPVTFVTTDAVVIQSGHVLLVKRRTAPGKGLWALPGGFIGQHERLEDGVIRELREETKLKVPVPVLRGSIKATEVFDEPGRSLRGRTITNAFLFDLADQPKLPKVKGGDDAAEARWFPLDIVDEMAEVLFEDHKAIIHTMVAKLTD